MQQHRALAQYSLQIKVAPQYKSVYIGGYICCPTEGGIPGQSSPDADSEVPDLRPPYPYPGCFSALSGRSSHIAPVLVLQLHQGLESSRDCLVWPRAWCKSNKTWEGYQYLQLHYNYHSYYSYHNLLMALNQATNSQPPEITCPVNLIEQSLSNHCKQSTSDHQTASF